MTSSKRTIGGEVRHVRSTGSTMDDLAQLARDGVEEGTVLWADEQTAGRGRHQRAWQSQAGEDLLFSVLFRPRAAIAGEINMLIALAIAETVETRCGRVVTLKWPNDVMVNEEKIAGVLLESVQVADGLSVVAGIGLNVNSRMRGLNPGGSKAVSMLDLAGRKFDRDLVLENLLERMDSLYDEVRAGGSALTAWRGRLATIGKEVEVVFTGGSAEPHVIVGVAEDVDSTGRLIIRDDNGRMRAVAAGEVTLRRNGRIS